MGTTFDGATRADVQRFAPEALDSIILGNNLRRDLGDLEELARRIAKDGQLQPGIIRRDHEGRPVLVAGYRRLAAVKLINTDPSAFGASAPVPYLATFRRMSEDESLVINLRENIDRKELSDVDLAHAAAELERLGWARKKIAEAMRCTTAHVGNLLGLVELPGKVQDLVHHGTMPTSAALAMRTMTPERVNELAEQVERGESKPKAVIQEAKTQKRAAGKKLSRSIAEVKTLLEDIGTIKATDFSAWIDGEVTITDEVVREIFADRENRAA